MKRSLLVGFSLAILSLQANAGDPKSVLPEIKKIASNPAVVAAVKAQNAQNLSLDAIKTLDASWIEKKGQTPEAEAQMNNEAAVFLKQAEASNAAFKESILTDNQGANVAISQLTSDYWQGDEPKFAKAFAGGAGSDYIARPKKDESTGEVVSQISVPVMDGGKAIGTLTIGVDLNKVP